MNIIQLRNKLLIILSTFLLITVSGLFIGGSESAVLVALVVGIVLFIIVASRIRYKLSIPGDAGIALRTNIVITIQIVSTACTIGLGWLVLHRKPLPLADFDTSGLITVLFSLVCIGLVWLLLDLPVLSFPMIYLGITFFYTTSSLILYQLEGFYAFRYWSFINIHVTMEAMPIVMLAFSAFLIGALVFSAKKRTNCPKPIEMNLQHPDDVLRQIGIILYFTSILLITFLGAKSGVLDLIVNGGYRAFSDAKRVNQISSLIISSLNWFLPWSLLILTATSRNHFQFLVTVVLAIPALGIMLITGDRSTLIPIIILMASARYILDGHASWRQTTLVVVMAMTLMVGVLLFRKTPLRDWSTQMVFSTITDQLNRNSYSDLPFAETMLGDMSSSYQTLVGTLLLVPDHFPYRYGIDYLKSLVFSVPFANSMFSSMEVDLQTDLPSEWVKFNSVSNPGTSGWGYLQIAEAYLQFGVFGVIAVFTGMGFFLPKLWWRLQNDHYHNSQFLAFALIVMSAFITWIRNYSGPVPRAILWGWVLAYGLPWLVKRVNSRSSFADSKKSFSTDLT